MAENDRWPVWIVVWSLVGWLWWRARGQRLGPGARRMADRRAERENLR